MARRGAPALYELMRQPGGASPAPRASVPGAGRHGHAPGIPDSFTVSFARLVMIAVGVVVAIAIAYGTGGWRGAEDPVARRKIRGRFPFDRPVAQGGCNR
jgi:hypothetical protein